MDEMADCGQPPQPSPEHLKLMENVGTWNVDCKFFMGPDAPPMESKATDEIVALGPFWLMSTFKSDFMGMPFEGRCSVGFDPIKGKYVSTWVDQMSPHIFISEGGFDESGTVLTLEGRAPHFATGEITDFKIVEEHKSADHRIACMYVGGMQTFEMVYTR